MYLKEYLKSIELGQLYNRYWGSRESSEKIKDEIESIPPTYTRIHLNINIYKKVYAIKLYKSA